MQTLTVNLIPLPDEDLVKWRQDPSHLFEDSFDPAISGTTFNTAGRRVLVYDEEKLIDLMVGQMKEVAEDPDEILWEDGAMFISDGLEMSLERLGDRAPIVI